jgi:hypothetical protein
VGGWVGVLEGGGGDAPTHVGVDVWLFEGHPFQPLARQAPPGWPRLALPAAPAVPSWQPRSLVKP